MKKRLPYVHAPMCTVRRTLVAQLDEAAAQLLREVPSDRAVHCIREQLKRSRAALRLLRTCIGTAAYRRHNALIRDAARPLTQLRDSRVLLLTLRGLKVDAASSGRVAVKRRPIDSFTQMLGRELRRRQTMLRQGLKRSDLHAAAATLRGVKRRLESIPDARLAGGVLAEALERAYRAARKAYRRTLLLPTDERLHEWRKQTKYLLHQLDMVAAHGSARFWKRRKRARRLARCLGDDHDLALLHAQLRNCAKSAGAAASDAQAAELSRRLERCRRELQREARGLGRRLYRRKPAHMRRKLEQRLGAARASAPAE